MVVHPCQMRGRLIGGFNDQQPEVVLSPGVFSYMRPPISEAVFQGVLVANSTLTASFSRFEQLFLVNTSVQGKGRADLTVKGRWI